MTLFGPTKQTSFSSVLVLKTSENCFCGSFFFVLENINQILPDIFSYGFFNIVADIYFHNTVLIHNYYKF